VSVTATRAQLSNWSGSHRYRAATLERPESLDELATLLTESTDTVQVLATRHTFTAMGDAHTLVALDRIRGADAIVIDPAARTATVGPAVTYAQLARALSHAGLALPNLASLPHISVIGGIATASHGSGDRLGNLATAVVELELLTADGELLTLSRGDPRFPGAVVHLGALGVVTRVTLDCVPYYELRQDVYLGLEWDALAAHFDEVTGAGRNVSVFHDFGARTREVWVKSDPGTPARRELFGAVPAHEARNPVPGGLPANCTAQLGAPAPLPLGIPPARRQGDPVGVLRRPRRGGRGARGAAGDRPRDPAGSADRRAAHDRRRRRVAEPPVPA
jgi:xylitol oxidase